jgi:hypothetical protein
VPAKAVRGGASVTAGVRAASLAPSRHSAAACTGSPHRQPAGRPVVRRTAACRMSCENGYRNGDLLFHYGTMAD